MRQVSLLWFFFCFLFAAAGACAQGARHDPMLPSVYPGSAPMTEYWVSEKLDGVRGHWDGDALWTRSGYRINAPVWFTRGWPSMPMDGELWIAREHFDMLSATVRKASPDEAEWQKVKFMVFDLPAHGGAFDERVEAMRAIAAYSIAWLQPVRQFRVESPQALDRQLEALVAAGAEGLMLHHQDAMYLSGRSQDLLKYKLYDDAEARVVGYTAGEGKYVGQVGALKVESADGKRFRLGSGLSDAERTDPPPVGSWVTYRYNGLTSNGLPRFARFIRVRANASAQ